MTKWVLASQAESNTKFPMNAPTIPIQVKPISQSLDYILEHSCSVARFGDGEMNIIGGHSIPYQDYDPQLASELKEILGLESDKSLMVCLPEVFENREGYTEAFNHFWLGHLQHYQDYYRQICKAPWYGNAFISRPYMDLADKGLATTYFQTLKQIWTGKDILIVEGKTSRSGVGNDLFQAAKSIQRIICPSKNAYAQIEDILTAIEAYGKGKLVLLMLGPTAKALVYRLAKTGIQAIDIGHIDSEYEWFTMQAQSKIKLQHKHTAEHNFDQDIVFTEDQDYLRQIVLDLTGEIKHQLPIPQIKVSLLLPIYNETSLTTIEKICKQSYKNIQLILLNYDPEMTIQMEDIRSKSLLDVENIAILKIGSETKLEQDLLELVEGQYLLSLNHIDDLDDRLLEKAIDSAEKYQSEIVLLENSIFDENDGNYYFYDKLFNEKILRAETVKGYFETSPRHQNYLTNNYAKLFKTSYVKENHINLTQDFTPETYNSDKISYVKENLYVYKKIKEELVSVIVPVYNVENYLSQCLDSIIHQTYKNLEIILVNDGSTDGSGKICDDYAAKDGRIKVIHQENGGLSDARNKGLDLITGQFVTFVDSDDYLENNCIHTLYTYACTCKTDISIGKFIKFEENTSQFLFHNHLNNGNKIEFLTGDQCLERHHQYFLGIFVNAWAKLYRTSLFNDSNPCKSIRYPLGVLHEDQYTTHKLFFKSNKIVFVNDYLYVYRVRENSITNTLLSDKRIMDNIRGLEEKIVDFCLLNKDMTLLREYYLFYLNDYKAYLENNHRQNSDVYEFIQKRLGTYSNWK